MPFEHDDLELIEACIQALQSVAPVPGRVPDAARSNESDPASAVRVRRETTETQTRTASVMPVSEQSYEFLDLPIPQRGALDVEALSRAVERDARRFEK